MSPFLKDIKLASVLRFLKVSFSKCPSLATNLYKWGQDHNLETGLTRIKINKKHTRNTQLVEKRLFFLWNGLNCVFTSSVGGHILHFITSEFECLKMISLRNNKNINRFILFWSMKWEHIVIFGMSSPLCLKFWDNLDRNVLFLSFKNLK